MGRRAVPGLLAAGAAAVWILWRWVPIERPPDSSFSTESVSVAETAPETGSTAAPVERFKEEKEILAELGESVPTSVPVSASRSVLLRLVAAHTKVALPDAEVRWIALPPDDAVELDVDAAFAASDESVHSDADGHVELVATGKSILVRATRGSLYGEDRIWPELLDNEPLELELYPDGDLVVHVEDMQGRALGGFPVTLRSRREDFVHDEIEVETGADGRAFLRHAGYAMQRFEFSGGREDAERMAWSLVLDTCLPSPVETGIDVERLPADPIVLVAPATGSVSIEATDFEGRHVSIEGCAFLARTAAQEPEKQDAPYWLSRELGYRPAEMVEGRVEEGRARFPYVGLGLTLDGWVKRNAASTPVDVRGEGPRAESETATLRAIVGSEATTLFGRAVAPDGTPLGGVELFAELLSVRSEDEHEFGFGSMSPTHYDELGTVRTGSDGHFAVDVAFDADSKESWSLILARDRNQPHAIEARRELLGTLAQGPRDLGDVRFEPAPLLVEGRVVDPGEKPIAGARVHIQLQERHGGSRIVAKSDTEGAFVLRGIQFDPGCWLFASADGHADWSGAATKGDRNVVIILPRCGDVSGRIELPVGGSGDDLSVSIVRDSGSNDDGSGGDGYDDNWSTGAEDDGSFHFANLPPARWKLAVKSKQRSILLEKEFDIRPGESTDLGVLSVATTSNAFVLKVVDAVSGAALSGAYCVRPRGSGRMADLLGARPMGVSPFDADGAKEFKDGELRILSADASIDVVLGSLGHRCVVVTTHPGELEVRLPSGILLPLKIANFSGLPPEPQQLVLQFQLETGSARPFVILPHTMNTFGRSSAFDETGVAEVRLPGAGTWGFTWMVVTPIGGGYRGSGFGSKKLVTLNEDEQPGELLLYPDFDTTKGDAGD